MKQFVLILLALAAAAPALALEEYVPPQREPEKAGFIGYAANRIVVRFSPPGLTLIDRSALPRGRTGLPVLDATGIRFGVDAIRPQFPGSPPARSFRGRTVDLSGWHRVHFSAPIDVLEAVREYRALPYVADAQPVGIHAVQADPVEGGEGYYDLQWHLRKIGAPAAWDVETGNPEIVVAVADTGVRYFHKDLGGPDAGYEAVSPYPQPGLIGGNIWRNGGDLPGNGLDDDGNGYIDDWVGWDFVSDADSEGGLFFACAPGEDCEGADNDPRDFDGHGTHCAGNVAALTDNGYALAGAAGGWGPDRPGVRIMPLRIGWSADLLLLERVGLVAMDYAAEALYYAAENGVRIFSASWGSSADGGLPDAVDYFLAGGGLIFKAAGNDGGSTPDYLASRRDVVAVAATDRDDCRASFSNYGSWIGIAAPGVDIWSLYHLYDDPEHDYVGPLSGTSMATPLAASVAALIWSHYPGWTAEQVRRQLLESADPGIYDLPCNAGYTGQLGAGRIDARAALLVSMVDFTGEPTTGEAPLTVKFIDRSATGAEGWLWNFGDGEISDQRDPNHTYYEAGSYTVSLTVTWPTTSATETRAEYIAVTEPAALAGGVDSLETGTYRTTGKGRNRSTTFVPADTFQAGDEVIVRARVRSGEAAVPGALVELAVSGPANAVLLSAPADADGIAEASWQTMAPKNTGRKNARPGTPAGRYTVTVTGVTADGFTWDGASATTGFTLE